MMVEPRVVLEERGVETKGMNADKMREVLNTFQDFKKKKNFVRREGGIKGTLLCIFP